MTQEQPPVCVINHGEGRRKGDFLAPPHDLGSLLEQVFSVFFYFFNAACIIKYLLHSDPLHTNI